MSFPSSQFLARALQPDHVTNPYAKLDQGSRKLKHTLHSKCIADVQPYLEADGSLGRGIFGFVKNQLHTDIVRKASLNRGPNRVLGSHPPPIHASEAQLPRLTRTTLSQLRSGHCGKLRDFQKVSEKRMMTPRGVYQGASGASMDAPGVGL